jgi:hypothetical protein
MVQMESVSHQWCKLKESITNGEKLKVSVTSGAPASECSQADALQRMLSSGRIPAIALKRTPSSECSQADAFPRMLSSRNIPSPRMQIENGTN